MAWAVRAIRASSRERRVRLIQVVFRRPEHGVTFRAADFLPVEHFVREAQRATALGTGDLNPGHDPAFESATEVSDFQSTVTAKWPQLALGSCTTRDEAFLIHG